MKQVREHQCEDNFILIMSNASYKLHTYTITDFKISFTKDHQLYILCDFKIKKYFLMVEHVLHVRTFYATRE